MQLSFSNLHSVCSSDPHVLSRVPGKFLRNHSANSNTAPYVSVDYALARTGSSDRKLQEAAVALREEDCLPALGYH